MRIALLGDIHANRQAFGACLDHAAGMGAERYALLGDFVGYGADPAWCVAKAMELVAGGAIAVMGNHDAAIGDPDLRMREEVMTAVAWTRGQLGVAERQFLAGLPLTYEEGMTLYVHGDASAPDRWIYVTSVEQAGRSLHATEAQITFCGHAHRPAIFSVTALSKMTAFVPVTDVSVPLHGLRRWQVVLGSVGQPRDGVAAACYSIFDTDKREITFHRVPYNVEAAAAAIRKAALPQYFAERLFYGR